MMAIRTTGPRRDREGHQVRFMPNFCKVLYPFENSSNDTGFDLASADTVSIEAQTFAIALRRF